MKYLGFCALLLLSALNCRAGTAVQVIPSSTFTVIGAMLPITVKVIHPPGKNVTNIVKPVGPAFVWGKIRHNKGSTEDDITSSVRIYDLGEVSVPAPEIFIGTAAVKGAVVKINVNGRLGEKDTEIKKIRPQIGGGFPYLYLLATVVLIAAAYFIFIRKKKIAEVEKYVSPEEWYLAELGKISLDREAKEILDEASDLYRVYIEKKYDVPAIYQSSTEIITEMKNLGFPASERHKVAAFFNSCDLAKFAKKEFVLDDLKKLISQAKDFAAKPEPASEENGGKREEQAQ